MKADYKCSREGEDQVIYAVAAHPKDGFTIDDEFLDEVENRVGIGHIAWDTVNPKELMAFIICEFLERFEIKKQ